MIYPRILPVLFFLSVMVKTKKHVTHIASAYFAKKYYSYTWWFIRLVVQWIIYRNKMINILNKPVLWAGPEVVFSTVNWNDPETLVLVLLCSITKTRLFKYTENFTSKKWKFSDKKKSDIFHISPQNIGCGYSLEPPRWGGGSNEYPQSMSFSRNKKDYVYLCKPQFYYIKVGFKRVKII